MTHSFPTRRSSDLISPPTPAPGDARRVFGRRLEEPHAPDPQPPRRPQGRRSQAPSRPRQPLRSEEHTYELQSLMRNSYAVFCLKTKKLLNKQQQQKQSTVSKRAQTIPKQQT